MHASDGEIIARILAGARHQFSVLVDRHKDMAMALAYRMLKNRQDAEEATQDAFIRAFNALEQYQSRAKFATWLYRIVYNVCLTRLSKEATEPEQIEFDDGRTYDGWDLANFSLTDFESADMLSFLKKAIDELPPKYSSILTLFYTQDLTHEEICEVTGLPLGTVKVHLFRARALLMKNVLPELHYAMGKP